LIGSQSRITPAHLERALDTIRLRGPDDEGYVFFDVRSGSVTSLKGRETDCTLDALRPVSSHDGDFSVALCHRRLSVLDMSAAGHQPMPCAANRYWIVFNGEIYNFIELRRELEGRGHRFSSNSDTEVILAAYAEWGTAMLPKFVGMFALAILDTRDKTVFLARDPFGIKPLFWTRIGSAFAFASEITPLLALRGEQPRAGTDALYQYLRFGTTDGGGQTLFADIRQIPAAHYVVLDAESAASAGERPYWSPGAVPPRKISFLDAAAELRHLFDESVRLHLRSDVPLGSCLSGGLDSTALVASMRAQLGGDTPIHAFSFLSEDPARSEGPYIDMAVRAFDLTAHTTQPTAGDLAGDLSRLIRLQEQPFGSTSIYAQYCVFQLARRAGITVMLDGQGSDELFGGYQSAISAQLSAALVGGNLGSVSGLLRSGHFPTAASRRRILLSAAGRLLPSGATAPFMALVGEQPYSRWMNARWFAARDHRAAWRPQGTGRRALRDELLHAVQTTSLPALLRYEDRNSMAFSIESRVPFCTVPLADFAFSLPPAHLVSRTGDTKAVLRRAMRGLVPDEIIDRPKVGFETPERQWLQTLRPWIQQVTGSEAFRSLPFIDHTSVLAEVSTQLASEGPMRPALWRLLNAAMWSESFDLSYAP
jgi:asparagine synthase (glutamine-hydrolysing)